MKRYAGAIFDLNGTLFWDTPLHNRAWDIFLKNHGFRLSDEEKHRNIHGKTNQDILRGLFEHVADGTEIQQLIQEKEVLYQKICLERQMGLAPGATRLLKFLRRKGIPFTIATASGKENIDFYFKYLHLGNWFSREKVVYNDGSFKGKPNPDIFLIAARMLKIAPGNLVVFEDSVSGLEAAGRAGIGLIYIVNSNNENYSAWSYVVIRSFDEVDRRLFSVR
jgi:HAD superfamily hydrolase (TIGR01509 family)